MKSKDKLPNRALFIGGGAIGHAVGAALTAKGFSLGLIGRHGPLALTGVFDDGTHRQPIAFHAADREFCQSAGIAFLAVKAHDLQRALTQLSDLKPDTPVIPLSNGAVEGLIRQAAAKRPELAWRLGFCTFGVTATGPHAYALKSKTGELAFGPLSSPLEPPTPIEESLIRADSIFSWHPHIARLVHKKWLYNTVINSLAAARAHKRNGDLLGDLPTLVAVFHEAFSLSEKLYGPWPIAKGELYKGLLQLIEATQDNENSMARDVRLKLKTESDFLAGLTKGDAEHYPLLTGLHQEISSRSRI